MSIVFAGMAASLDGFIAVPSGDLSWINDAMSPTEDYGFAKTMQRTGAYIIGAKTYREMLRSGMAAGDATPTYVLTHQTDLERSGNQVAFFDGDVRSLMEIVQARTDKDICVFGGADVVTQFINADLLDELAVSIIPILLGEGVPFFGRIHPWKKLALVECQRFDSGIVALNYRCRRSAPA
jgi:dihydrofolate reductase